MKGEREYLQLGGMRKFHEGHSPWLKDGHIWPCRGGVGRGKGTGIGKCKMGTGMSYNLPGMCV